MKIWVKKLSIAALFAAIFIVISFQVIFTVPIGPQQLVFEHDHIETLPTCYKSTSSQPIDNNGQLNLLVWNIYKQNRDNWQTALTNFSQNVQLLLLQEVSLTPSFREWIGQQTWGSNYVTAFSAFETSSGVLNLATHFPIEACAYVAKEPWLRLPKSGLYARYLLSNNQQLAVINVHAINFTLGVDEYEQQLNVLKKALSKHNGPIIMAGDFNTWNDKRLAGLERVVTSLGLDSVEFTPDNRKQFINGMPLDHVYFKGLMVEKAEAPITDASDHNPLRVNFRIEK